MAADVGSMFQYWKKFDLRRLQTFPEREVSDCGNEGQRKGSEVVQPWCLPARGHAAVCRVISHSGQMVFFASACGKDRLGASSRALPGPAGPSANGEQSRETGPLAGGWLAQDSRSTGEDGLLKDNMSPRLAH
ncbi:hypothetical protein GN956_G1296 [Arapaima gigas]